MSYTKKGVDKIMERDEITIDLREMVLYVARKWKLLVLCMVIFAVLCDVFSFVPLTKGKDSEVTDAKNNIETTKEVEEVDQAFGAYSKYKEQYDNTFDYISGSVMMGLDASAVAKDSIVYRISSEDAVDIAKSLENFTADDELRKNIANILDCEEKYAGELVTVSNATGEAFLGDLKLDLNADSAVVVVTVYSSDETKLTDLGNTVSGSFEAYAASMSDTYGQFTIVQVAQQQGVTSDTILATSQQNTNTTLESLKTAMDSFGTSFTAEQTKYFEALKDNMKADDKEKEISYINVKYIVLGAAAGFILPAIILAILYILSRKLKAVSDVSDSFRVDVLGNVVDGTDKAKAQEQIEYICAQLAVLAEKSQKKNIVFASTVDSKNLAGIDEIADKAIGKTLSDAKYAGAVLSDAKALKDLEAAEGVVLIEKLFTTTYNDFEKELQLCKRLNIPVVGCIVVR